MKGKTLTLVVMASEFGLEEEEERGSLRCLGRLLAECDALQLHPLGHQSGDSRGGLGAGADHSVSSLRPDPAHRGLERGSVLLKGDARRSLGPEDRSSARWQGPSSPQKHPASPKARPACLVCHASPSLPLWGRRLRA